MSQSRPQNPNLPSEAAQHAFEATQASFTRRNPRSLKAYKASCANLPGGNTRTVLHAFPFPLTFSSASSCSLQSLDGHTYIDFLGEYTAGIYGHNHPDIRAAIDSALDSGWSFGGTNMYEKELAKIVCERFAPTMELVRFCNSGTEANMMAVAAAVAWTGRKKVLVFEGGYHGSTLSFRARPNTLKERGVKTANLPHEWVVAPFNHIKKTKDVLSQLEPESLAAIIVEPMLGSGGGIPGSREFLQFLRDHASENGAVLIFDEVMTSRLGYRGLGYELGLRPDLMTLGKWVGGGMSFGAFGGRRDIMDMFDPRSGVLAHAGTFNNNVMSMAAGIAGCKILDEHRTAALNSVGEQMKKTVQAAIDENLKAPDSDVSVHSIKNDAINGKVDTCASTSTNDPISNHKHQSNDHDPSVPSSKMWISGLGSILVAHFAPSPIQSTLQSLYYHHMLTEGFYIAERGFMALSIEIRPEHVKAFAAATARFVSKHGEIISGVN